MIHRIPAGHHANGCEYILRIIPYVLVYEYQNACCRLVFIRVVQLESDDTNPHPNEERGATTPTSMICAYYIELNYE